MHFENAAYKATANFILTSYFYVCYHARHFLWQPLNAINENWKQVYNSMHIALLKNGFVPVKHGC